MTRMLDEFRPDIVHIHGLYQQLTPSVLAPIAARGIPIVYTVHDYKLLCPAYHALHARARGVRALRQRNRPGTAAIHKCLHDSRPVSTVYAAEALYHRWRGSYDAVTRLRDAQPLPAREAQAVWLSSSSACTTCPISSPPRPMRRSTPAAVAALRATHGDYVLFFGRLSPEKGCGVLVEACAPVPWLKLVLAGDGPEDARLRTLAARLGAQVEFAGYRSGADLWHSGRGRHVRGAPGGLVRERAEKRPGGAGPREAGDRLADRRAAGDDRGRRDGHVGPAG